jgi:hypothetical protein
VFWSSKPTTGPSISTVGGAVYTNLSPGDRRRVLRVVCRIERLMLKLSEKGVSAERQSQLGAELEQKRLALGAAGFPALAERQSLTAIREQLLREMEG